MWPDGQVVYLAVPVSRKEKVGLRFFLQISQIASAARRLLNLIQQNTKTKKKGGEGIMKFLKATVTAVLLTGTIVGGALAADGVLMKEEVTPGSYCHMKFPAISEQTLFTDHPQPESSTSADVIDFYGPCDESPTAKDQVMEQRDEQNRDWRE